MATLAQPLVSPAPSIRPSAATWSPPPPAAWQRAQSLRLALQRALSGSVRAHGPLGAAARHHLSRPGKLFRGLLALAASESTGVPRAVALEIALATELLHSASLVHDDLQDRDEERRGQATVWRRFGDDVALTLGDLLLTRSLDVLAHLRADDSVRVALIRRFTSGTMGLIRGQAADNALRAAQLDPERVEQVARRKTGPLLALPVEAAILASPAVDLALETVRSAMDCLGAAYQIQDDVLDLLGAKEGRRTGSDLEAGRPSAPVAHFLVGASSRDRKRLLGFLDGHRRDWGETARWVDRIRSSGAVDAAMHRFLALEREGLEHLAGLPDALKDVIQFATGRMLAPGHAVVKEPVPLAAVEESAWQ